MAVEVGGATPGGRARRWISRGILARIDSRVARPGDSATRRLQKVLVVVVAFGGSVATVFNAVPLLRGGLDAMGWTYVASAGYILFGGLAILAWPRAYSLVTFLLLLDVLVFPAITQVLSGGLTSGLYALPWTLLAPLGAVLALGSRPAIAHLVLFVVTVVTVVLLEPVSRSVSPEIDPDVLVSYNVPSLLSLGAIAAATSLHLLRQVERFRGQADALLLNILPDTIATRLKTGEKPIADRHESVSVLFADIVGFTRLSSDADPGEVVQMLNGIFSRFDDLAAKHGVHKIKTVGDAYMAVAGLPDPRSDHTEAIIGFALDILTSVETHPGLGGEPIRLRIGINTGPVVAGVIGHDRFIYDLWGDTVNVASRMESNGVPGQIQVTRAVKERVGDKYQFEQRDPIDVKGKGMTVTYALVVDRRSAEVDREPRPPVGRSEVRDLEGTEPGATPSESGLWP